MVVRIVGVTFTRDAIDQPTQLFTIGEPIKIEVEVVENNWLAVKESFTNWQDIKTNNINWLRLRNF